MSARRRGTGPGPNTTRRLRRRLLTARRALFVEIQDVEHDLLVLEQEPRSELEERSQGEASARLLTRLEDREQAELREIEDALARIDAGTYGSCASCGCAIPVARLEAGPAATLCLACEETHETTARIRVEEHENGSDAASDVPPELRDLDDREIAVLVRERFETEVGAALRDIRVRSRSGVVTLRGEAATNALAEIAMHIVEDEIGLTAVNRMRVTQLSFGRDVAAPEAMLEPDAIDARLFGSTATTEDVFEAEESGLDYAPPDRPVAEIE